MSLWLESLRCVDRPLDGAPEDERRAHALRLVEHLAMPVPREWWQRVLDGHPVADWQRDIMDELRAELGRSLGHDGLALEVLLALPFACEAQRVANPADAVAAADQLLLVRGDLYWLSARLQAPGETDLGPQYPRDNRLTAKLRRHQSWYRARVLGMDHGVGPKPTSASRFGNMLTTDDAERGANFLTPGIFAVAQRRLAENTGVVERFRLLHNMLSSQPMCFNLFGPLVDNLELATRLMNALTEGEVDEVLSVRLEFGPEPAKAYLNDRTAFDAYVEWRRPDGQLAFIGFETKLSEPFSQKVYDGPAYRRWMDADAPWRPGADVANIRHNQLWRDHLLAVAHHRQSGRHVHGRLAVVRHSLDLECQETVAGYRQTLRQGDDTLVELTLAQIVDAWSQAVQTDAERAWLAAFRLRYLDLAASEG